MEFHSVKSSRKHLPGVLCAPGEMKEDWVLISTQLMACLFFYKMPCVITEINAMIFFWKGTCENLKLIIPEVLLFRCHFQKISQRVRELTAKKIRQLTVTGLPLRS